MKKDIREYGEAERREMMFAVIAEYRKGRYTIKTSAEKEGITPGTFYDYVRKYEDIRNALREAKYHVDGTYDGEMKVATRQRMRLRMSGKEKQTTKTATIRARVAGVEREKTFNVTDDETFAAIMEFLSGDNVTDVNIEVKVSERQVLPSDAFIVAASIQFDGGAEHQKGK